MEKFVICCISHRRPQNIKKVYETTGTENILWVVNDDLDVETYTKHGAINIIKGGSLSGNRNAALEYCFTQNKICIQIDDDLQRIAVNDFTGKRSGLTVNVMDVINDILPEFEASTSFYAGFPPTSNPFFALKKVEKNKLITAPFTFTKPNALRYDMSLNLKEDYDYTLQHIKEHGECTRYAKYLMHFKSNKGTGGAVDYRSDSTEQTAIKHLMLKWEGCLALNLKRKNEILIKKGVEKMFNSGQVSLF